MCFVVARMKVYIAGHNGMVGAALVLEHARLQERMNLYFDKLESSFKQRNRCSNWSVLSPITNGDFTISDKTFSRLIGLLQKGK